MCRNILRAVGQDSDNTSHEGLYVVLVHAVYLFGTTVYQASYPHERSLKLERRSYKRQTVHT